MKAKRISKNTQGFTDDERIKYRKQLAYVRNYYRLKREWARKVKEGELKNVSFQEYRELKGKVVRRPKPQRITLKKFRYEVENLLKMVG